MNSSGPTHRWLMLIGACGAVGSLLVGCGGAPAPSVSNAEDSGAAGSSEQDIRDVVLDEWDIEELLERVGPLMDAARETSLDGPRCDEASGGSHVDGDTGEVTYWCGERPSDLPPIMEDPNEPSSGSDQMGSS